MSIRVKSLSLVALLTILPLCVLAASRGGTSLAEGSWGGPHIQMTVGPQGVALELDCAHGEITEPIVIGRDGRFRASGTYVPEHGGPAREGDETSARAAVYTGRVEGKTLSLGIAYENGEEVGTFQLVHGRAGRITKCL